MTIAEKIQAVKEWLNFEEAWYQANGDTPRLQDWEATLKGDALAAALREIRAHAEELLEVEATLGTGERILAEIEASGV